jgi:hypothetical protein
MITGKLFFKCDKCGKEQERSFAMGCMLIAIHKWQWMYNMPYGWVERIENTESDIPVVTQFCGDCRE